MTTAQELDQILVQELKPLAMEKVQFQVKLAPAAPSSTGADIIAFYFSPNPGEPLQPIAAIASGGEMSRFLLALKACFSQVDSASTLVFDEIDVGVSGRVAQAIAAKLYQLSHRHQVLCVTHQPLVAAMADHHFRVDKETINSHLNPENNLESIHPAERTVVRATILDNSQRREELAQLAGGQSAQEAIAFAESLLAQAERWRQNQPPALADSPQ
jgi:DNA repair protein RecN (Recombination protein N)